MMDYPELPSALRGEVTIPHHHNACQWQISFG
jgi:hypothetical protein